MKFFTLIHICRDEQSIHNNSFTRSFDEQISLYLECAKQLHRSLKREGISLAVLTNDKDFLQRLNTDGYNIDIIQLDFSLDVPSGIKFYSAHFKLEVFEYLSSLQEDYVSLVDSDMVCINKVPESFITIVKQKIPLYYDITDQVSPAYGASNIIKDKERISNSPSIGLWAGGEFISGVPAFFKKLSIEVNKYKGAYLEHFSTFHHQGDEVLTSVAIEQLKLYGNTEIVDAGSLAIVGRFWSPRTLHVQKPVNAYGNHFLLHLPSDKKFIKRLAPDELMSDAFFNNYKKHLLKSRIVEHAIKGIKPYAKQLHKKFAG